MESVSHRRITLSLFQEAIKSSLPFIVSHFRSRRDIAFLLNQETIPVKYVQDGGALFIESDLTEEMMTIFYWSIVAILVLIIVIFFIKYKARGFLAGILNFALIGLIILVLKYVELYEFV